MAKTNKVATPRSTQNIVLYTNLYTHDYNYNPFVPLLISFQTNKFNNDQH